MFGKRNAAILVAEFLGTAVLTLLVFSVQRSQIGVPFFVAIAAGLAIVVMAFAVGRTSGGYFNPALTIAFWTARQLSSVRAITMLAAQFLGGYTAYFIYKYLTKGDLQDVGGEFTGRVMVAEALGAGIFAFGFAAAVYQRFTLAASAAVAGLSLTVGIIAASSASLALLNPAVAFGVKAWEPTSYVLGPILGAVIAVNLYALLYAPRETVAAASIKPAKVAAKATSKASAKTATATKKTTKKAATAKRKTTRAAKKK